MGVESRLFKRSDNSSNANTNDASGLDPEQLKQDIERVMNQGNKRPEKKLPVPGYMKNYMTYLDAAIATVHDVRLIPGLSVDELRRYVNDELMNEIIKILTRYENRGASDYANSASMRQTRQKFITDEQIANTLLAAQQNYDELYRGGEDEEAIERRQSLLRETWPWVFGVSDFGDGSSPPEDVLEITLNELTKKRNDIWPYLSGGGVDNETAEQFNEEVFNRWKAIEAIIFICEAALVYKVLVVATCARNLIPDSEEIFAFLGDRELLGQMFNAESSAVVYCEERLDVLGSVGANIEKITRSRPRDKKEIGVDICQTIGALVQQHRDLYQQLDHVADLVL
ncbi:hypothetical protein FWH58_02615 [Candidatus Saccharibacteria bacterium]|nr:hypothetical protein [Candidatus Saccharibacteria bacterium]